MAKRATIADVAKISNVSRMTVSRVIRNSGSFKESTRIRVNDAIKRLNYHPDFSARALSNHVTGNIGFLVSRKKEFNDFVTHLAFAVEDSLFARNYSVLTCMQPLDPGAVPVMISQRKIDGLIAVGHEISQSIIDACNLNDIHVVLIEGFFRKRGVTLIHADYSNGIAHAVSHLIEQGHRQFSFIGNNLRNKSDQRKLANFKKTLKNYNISLPESNVIFSDNYNNDCKAFIDILLFKNPQLSAFLCENDCLAAKIVDQFTERNIAVPEDIGVIGFGNTELAKIKHPFISTIAIDVEKMGSLAVEELFKKINKKFIKSNHIHVPTELIIRESSNRLEQPIFTKEVMPQINLVAN